MIKFLAEPEKQFNVQPCIYFRIFYPKNNVCF